MQPKMNPDWIYEEGVWECSCPLLHKPETLECPYCHKEQKETN